MSGNEERAMLLFAQLAAIADQKSQPIGRDRFLVLSGLAATRAGWPDVARRCHELITASSDKHLVGQHASFADALRDDDFQPFVRQVEKFCSIERAEHLLSEMGVSPLSPTEDQSAGQVALAQLHRLSGSEQ